MPGHLLWLAQVEQKQKSWRYIGQNSIFAAKLCSIVRHVDDMHKVAGVSSVRRPIRVTHLLTITVVGGDDGFSVKFKEFRNDSLHAFIYSLDSLDSRFYHTRVANH